MKRVATALMVLVVTASVAPVAVGQSGGQASGEAYAGTHVSFETSERAVTDYAVRNETILESVKVESEESVADGGLVDLGGSLAAVTRIEGSALGLEADSETQARVAADGGATLTAHDNDRGVLVVASGNQSDYVVANVSAGANASAEGDSRVSVTTENGTQGTFLVVGNGTVAVNDDGDVTARLGEDGRLVFRAYPDGKDDADGEHEALIADGKAKAEAYVMAGEDDETVVDAISYADDTTVSANRTAEGAVDVTVNRTTHDGTIVITSVSEQVLDASDDLEVTIDGEAAVEAATYTQLESAVDSDRSRYLVASDGSADGSADVVVAVDHFSKRTISMQSASAAQATTEESAGNETTAENGDDETSDDRTTDETATDADNDGVVPGFTPATAVVALLAAALFARLR